MTDQGMVFAEAGPVEVIGTIIREARLSRDVTQESLAAAIGRSRTTIVNIESGAQGVTLGALYDIALALDTSVRDLLPDDPRENGSSTSAWTDVLGLRQENAELKRHIARIRRAVDV